MLPWIVRCALALILLAPARGYAAEAETDPPAEKPAFDPATFKLQLASPDGSFSIRFGLTAQIWLVVNEFGELGDTPKTRVHIRRVRPTLSGTAFTPRFHYLFHVSR